MRPAVEYIPSMADEGRRVDELRYTGPPMHRFPYFRWLLVALSAGLQLLPFPLAGPVPLWRRAFCWFCLMPLLAALLGGEKSSWRRPVLHDACLGWACGVLFYLGNCYWIFQTMYLYGGIAKPISAGILLLFSLYLGLYLALFGTVLGVLRRYLGAAWALALSPFVWVAVEVARDRITGLPWDLLGYALVDGAWARVLAPVTGVLGLSLLVAAVNAVLLCALRVRGSRRGWMAVVASTAFLASLWWMHPLEAYEHNFDQSAVLVQDNLGVGAEAHGREETEAQLFNDLARRTVAAERKNTAVVLWPEAPTPFRDNDPQFRGQLSELARQVNAPVIADDASVEPAPGTALGYHLYGSASVVRADGSYAGRYDKIHLVPFGEYVPYRQLLFFAGSLLDGVGQFEPGTERRTFELGGQKYGVFICYESIFGDEVRQFVANGANVLVNLSDDGWYGDTSAPWQHLDMVRMRAIENNRWVLRSTNTGVSGAISPQGVLTNEIPRHKRLATVVGFQFEDGTTFYTRHGDWIGWVCAAVSTVALLAGYARRKLADTGGELSSR